MSDNTSNQENITPSEGESRENIPNSEESSHKISENKEKQDPAETVSEPGQSEKEAEAPKEIPKLPLPYSPVSESSNYQISLINQNLLKVNVTTKKRRKNKFYSYRKKIIFRNAEQRNIFIS